jgi:hypothetical protein
MRRKKTLQQLSSEVNIPNIEPSSLLPSRASRSSCGPSYPDISSFPYLVLGNRHLHSISTMVRAERTKAGSWETTVGTDVSHESLLHSIWIKDHDVTSLLPVRAPVLLSKEKIL